MMADTMVRCRFEEEGFAAAYALGSLDGAERVAFTAHLRSCMICRAEVAAYVAAATDLPLAAATPDVPPVPALRSRVLAAAVAERDARRLGGTAQHLAERAPRPRRSPTVRYPAHIALFAVAAVLVLLFGAGLLIRTLGPDQGARDLAPSPAVFALTAGDSRAGQATYLGGERLLRLTFEGIPTLAPDRVYQLWLLRAEHLESARTFRLTGGAGTLTLAIDLAPYRALYVTIEPAPDGSPTPTTAPVVAAALGAGGPADGAIPTFPCGTFTGAACAAPQAVPGTVTRAIVATPMGTAALPLASPDRGSPTQNPAPSPAIAGTMTLIPPRVPVSPLAPTPTPSPAVQVPPLRPSAPSAPTIAAPSPTGISGPLATRPLPTSTAAPTQGPVPTASPTATPGIVPPSTPSTVPTGVPAPTRPEASPQASLTPATAPPPQPSEPRLLPTAPTVPPVTPIASPSRAPTPEPLAPRPPEVPPGLPTVPPSPPGQPEPTPEPTVAPLPTSPVVPTPGPPDTPGPPQGIPRPSARP